jgi:hypothetical protein
MVYILYMPYTFRKVPRRRCYRVYHCSTKKTYAKCTSKRKAIRQIRLLRALRYNPSFRQRQPQIHPSPLHSPSP